MRPTNVPTALLCMPPGEARNAVRAALMAMNVVPQDILPSATELGQLANTLQDAHTVAIMDLAGLRHAAAHAMALAALLPSPAVRQRTLLTRADRGLWPADRAWVQAQGFADLAAQLDAVSLGSESAHLLDWVARMTGAQPLQGNALARYFSAMQIKPDTTSPRGVIRKATGLSAEALCSALASNVKALNRTYHLKSYPSCFVGTEAVAWLAKQYTLPTDKAIALGTALQTLGMLHHVAHEHAFADEAFFYRTAVSTAVERMNPGALLHQLSGKNGVEVRDRLYHGKTYANCFIGSEAVDWVHTTHKMARHDAEIALNRLHGLNLIEHVTHDHPVRDGMFFYCFVV
jgi:Domain found in Dishevelled, Egl-10, and Pleckstrin (DEP)